MEEYQSQIYGEIEEMNLTIKLIVREMNQIIPLINGTLYEDSLAGEVLCGYKSAIEQYLTLNSISSRTRPEYILQILTTLRRRLKIILANAKKLTGPKAKEN